MRIGAVAEQAGVGVETVRFYERQGLIEQPTKPSSDGFRSYAPEIVGRIRRIRQAQSLGFSLNEIVELLSLKVDPSTDRHDVGVRAKAKLSDVNEKIAQLKTMQAALHNLISACPGEGSLAR